MIFADKIQINHPFSPIGISPDGLSVSWTVGGAKRQTWFQVSLYDGKNAGQQHLKFGEDMVK